MKPEKQPYEKYCTNCGALINANALECPKCHSKQDTIIIEESIQAKKTGDINPQWLVTLLLALFLGSLGLHRFYNGKTGTGIAMLLMGTIGILLVIPLFALGIWVLIDIIMIIMGSFTDKDGNEIPARI